MAITYVASSSNPADNGFLNGPVVTITPPTLTTGDLAVLICHFRRSSGDLSITNTGGQTWTTYAQVNATNCRILVSYCIFDGTWDADPEITATETYPMTLVMHGFRGVHATTPEDVALGNAAYSAPADPFDVEVPSINTATDGAVALFMWFTVDDETWTLQTAGWANAGTAQYRNTAGSDTSDSFAYKVIASAGATGAVTNRKQAATAGNYCTVAFKPIAAGGQSVVPNCMHHYRTMRG